MKNLYIERKVLREKPKEFTPAHCICGHFIRTIEEYHTHMTEHQAAYFGIATRYTPVMHS